ncbi:MAG: hypothetical protein UIV44_05345 [Bacteroidales bacterium]
MDIDLFSEMVKGLILDNDEVALPGLGTFVSELMPSSFSDKGYTINPPYRKLSFRQRESGNDRLLAGFYAKVNGTDIETSARILSEFIAGLKTTLQTRKLVVFPGLGRLRATKENTFFFIADEDLDIYPYAVGLEPVSLKTHEETPDEVAQSVAALRDLVAQPEVRPKDNEPSPRQPESEPAPETIAEAAPEMISEPAPEAAAKPAPEPVEEPRRRGRGWRTAILVAAGLAGLVALALGIFILLSHVAPDFIDSILYTPEELRIINY